MKWLVCALLVLGGSSWAQAPADSKQKIRQARDAAKQGPEVIPSLRPLIADPDVEVRREVVKALVSIGTQYSLEPLTHCLQDGDAEVQIRAIEGLVNFYDPGYVDTGLSATLRRAGQLLKVSFLKDQVDDVVDPDVLIRPEIVEGLRKVLRDSPDLVMRADAARALGILRAKAAVPDLVDGLRSKDDRLIFESLIALQKIGDRQSGARVVFLVHDLEPKVQKAAIETAGLLRAREAVADLLRVLESDPKKEIRRAAISALARIGDPAARTTLLPLLRDKDDDVRGSAAEGIGRMGDAGDLPLVERAFHEERKTLARLGQCFALVALGRVEMSEFSPLRYLVDNLNMRAWRGVAEPYLAELARRERVRQALYPALASGTKDEKTGIVEALAGSGGRDAVPVLEGLVRDSDVDVANAATRALRILNASLG
jgi:HEAT repeat protein